MAAAYLTDPTLESITSETSERITDIKLNNISRDVSGRYQGASFNYDGSLRKMLLWIEPRGGIETYRFVLYSTDEELGWKDSFSPIGSLEFSITDNEVAISDLAISKDAQSRGYASFAMRYLRAFLLDKKCEGRKISIEFPEESKDKVISLFKAFGNAQEEVYRVTSKIAYPASGPQG